MLRPLSAFEMVGVQATPEPGQKFCKRSSWRERHPQCDSHLKKKQQKFLGDLSKAGESWQGQSQHCASALHVAQPCVCIATLRFFFAPAKKRSALNKAVGFVESPFFYKYSKSELGPKARDQPAIRAEGGHWSSIELCVPGYGRIRKQELKM